MTRPGVPPAQIAAPVVPPHAGSGLLTPAQHRLARVRIAVEMLTQVVEELEACPAPVRQAACVYRAGGGGRASGWAGACTVLV